MRGFKLFLLILLWMRSAFAIFVGNPSEPGFYPNGIIHGGGGNYNLRFAYLCDNIYNSFFEDEFKTISSNSSELKLSSFLMHAVFDIRNKLDFYGMIGASKMQIDELIYLKRHLSWGLGTKAILFCSERFTIGMDLKYFETNQKPTYFVLEKTPADLLTPFILKYYEIQGACAVSFRADRYLPYAGITYLFAKVNPDSTMGRLYIPESGPTKFAAESSIISRRWGLVVGTTILSYGAFSLNIESRLINQNAVNVQGEFQF